ncbi:MAG: PIG-L deacetylase family protein [Lentisphaeria bacterium]
MDTIVFVGAHPDDFTCAMGGTAALLSNKYNIHVICATRGAVRQSDEKAMTIHGAMREKEKRSALSLINAKVSFLDNIDQEVYADRKTSETIKNILNQLKPVAVFTLWCVDNHPDHSAISEATRKALRDEENPPLLYFCECSVSGQCRHFIPTVWVDISSTFETKMKMLRCYKSQNHHDLLVKGATIRARFRGFEKNIYIPYAEAFICYNGFKHTQKCLLGGL